MNKSVTMLTAIGIGILLGIFSWWSILKVRQRSISVVLTPIVKPLDKYTVDALSNRVSQGSDFAFGEPTATTSSYLVRPFTFRSDGRLVSGIAHIPTLQQPEAGYPVILQIRGYVPRETYTSGVGTSRSAQVYAANGFVSLAPDFLGYGSSDMPPNDAFEERFLTYTTTMDLVSLLPKIPLVDAAHISLWGHSNGGQIALTVLEATGRPIPTTLWAPVTKPFPYSILYYTDDYSDHGKLLRAKLAEFEKDYDVERYSLTNYISRIHAPLLIHQGTADDAVPQAWSDEFTELLEHADKNFEYYTYPGADHNMVPTWDTVVSRDIRFFRSFLQSYD